MILVSLSIFKSLYFFNVFFPILNLQFSLKKDDAPEFYIYNETTSQKIYDCKNKLNLINKKYDSIFIRRGDKLVSESEYIPTVNYIELLLKKNPICNTIFLQTDDYNCYLDLVNYVTNNNLNIDIITLCNPKSLGGIVVNYMNTNMVIVLVLVIRCVPT